ncbi:MAG: Rne/Rng family ribonuclease [Legionellaceae bacterium]|nr:Rne/Rng family ribonuclease [Legionellaceae bacterium]
MERMLINAAQTEEIRVALVRDQFLYDLTIESPKDVQKKGSIYKATVTRIEPSLDAVFVEYGSKRQGFLPVKEIAPEYLAKIESKDGEEKPGINRLIREGQEILIQVDKEERGNKGAALTTYITLAGCYLVLMPNNPSSGGISRRIEGDERDQLKDTLNALNLPEGMGLIIRTAGVGKNQDELQADLDMLLNQWKAIQRAWQNEMAPCLLNQEGNVIIRSIRDNLRKTVSEIIIDDHVAYTKAREYIEMIKPEFLKNLKLYNSKVPLFINYGIESQIETAYRREVKLPSGGALVIDRTEALISIDVNSAKATGGSDIETTAYNTNLEAADEIARQLRIRDLGGLVVIDFIDMSSNKNQRDVENRLKEALQADRARIQIGRISRFGLLEMSRQRLRLSLGESDQDICPRCEGRGSVRNIQSHSLSLMRLIEEEALKEKTAEVQVQLPVEMATFLSNEKRNYIAIIEKRHAVNILLIANPYLQMPQYSINRIKADNLSKQRKRSYELIQQPEVEIARTNEVRPAAEPVVKAFVSAPESQKQQNNFIKRLWNSLFGASTDERTGAAAGTETNKARRSPAAQTATRQNSNSQRPEQRSQSQNRRRRPSGGANRTGSSANPQNASRNRRPAGSQGNRSVSSRTPATANDAAKKKGAKGSTGADS